MAKHFVRGGCGIKPFVDLYLIKKNLSFNEENLCSYLADAGLLAFYKTVVELLSVWFDNSSHTEKTKSLQDFIIEGGVYGTALNSSRVKAAKGEGKLKSFLKLMFLSRANLEIIYPELKKHPNKFPIFQVKRWFGVFNKDKREKIQNLTKVRNSVSNDELTVELLKELELL